MRGFITATITMTLISSSLMAQEVGVESNSQMPSSKAEQLLDDYYSGGSQFFRFGRRLAAPALGGAIAGLGLGYIWTAGNGCPETEGEDYCGLGEALGGAALFIGGGAVAVIGAPTAIGHAATPVSKKQFESIRLDEDLKQRAKEEKMEEHIQKLARHNRTTRYVSAGVVGAAAAGVGALAALNEGGNQIFFAGVAAAVAGVAANHVFNPSEEEKMLKKLKRSKPAPQVKINPIVSFDPEKEEETYGASLSIKF